MIVELHVRHVLVEVSEGGQPFSERNFPVAVALRVDVLKHGAVPGGRVERNGESSGVELG